MERKEITFEGKIFLVIPESDLYGLFTVKLDSEVYIYLQMDDCCVWREIDPETRKPIINIKEEVEQIGEIIFENYMRLYIYLNKEEYVDPWVNGGSIPLSFTTKYIDVERKGIKTPDENVQREIKGSLPHDLFKHFHGDSNSGSYRHDNNVYQVNGETFYVENALQFQDEAVVLCMSNKLSRHLADRLSEGDNKKVACVEIVDGQTLIYELSNQLGIEPYGTKCQYARSLQRNHFIKSHEDSWQKEFRVIWRFNPRYRQLVEDRLTVIIPSGMAKRIYWEE